MRLRQRQGPALQVAEAGPKPARPGAHAALEFVPQRLKRRALGRGQIRGAIPRPPSDPVLLRVRALEFVGLHLPSREQRILGSVSKTAAAGRVGARSVRSFAP